jgi:hypothetical protein
MVASMAGREKVHLSEELAIAREALRRSRRELVKD